MNDNPVKRLFTPGESLPPKSALVLAMVLLVLASCAVFANTLGNSFIWDDQDVIINDPFIRDLGNSRFLFSREYWQRPTRTAYSRGQYRPLSLVSFSLDHALWKDSPFGYHLTNLALHTANVLFVYLLFLRLPGCRRGRSLFSPAFLAALLFAVYPAHTEAVAWVKNRAELLSSFFFLSSFLMFLEYIRRDPLKARVHSLLASLLLFLMALLSKETALALPPLLLLYAAYYVPRGKLKKAGLGLLLFFSIMAVFLTFKMAVPDAASASPASLALSGHFQHLLVVLKTYGCYFWVMAWPFNLNAERVFAAPASLFEAPVLFSILLLVLILTLVTSTFRKRGLEGFSLLWMLVALIPASNIFLLSGRPIAEQRLYLASAGFCLLISLALHNLPRWRIRFMPPRVRRTAAFTLAAFLVVVFSAVTLERNTIWKDPVTFWSETLRLSPDSGRACNNLAFAYSLQGAKEKAVPLYRRSIELLPDYAQAYNNLGAAYAAMGRHEEALGLIREAIKIDPMNSVDYYNNLANIYLLLGQSEKAVRLYKKTMEMAPYKRDTYSNLSSLYLSQGRYEEAIKLNEALIKKDPGNAEAYHDLAMAYSFTGKVSRAVELYEKAARLSPGRADTYRNLGVIYGAAGRSEKSLAVLEKALKLDPSSAETLNYMGVAYFAAGDRQRSIVFFQKALDKQPGHLEAYRNLASVYDLEKMYDKSIDLHSSMLGTSSEKAEIYYNLGLAYFGKGELSSAETNFRRAIEADPGHVKAYNSLGVILGSMGRMGEAEETFKRSIQVAPGNAKAYYNLSLLCYRDGRHSEAMEYYTRSEQLGLADRELSSAIRAGLEKERSVSPGLGEK